MDTSYYVVARYMFHQETAFAFVTLLCIVMSVMLSLFTLYHLWLASTNVTTNERYKRAALQSYYEDRVELLKSWKERFSEFKATD